MPAAAVIPAPIAYTKVVAVKKLVVEFLIMKISPFFIECVLLFYIIILEKIVLDINLSNIRFSSFTVSKIECSKQA